MDRRRFLIAAAGTALAGCERLGDDAAHFLAGLGLHEPDPVVLRPGMAEGHALRDAHRWPQPTGERRVDVLILGSGIGGLSAAWQLSRAGLRDFVMLEGPEFGGNASGGRFGEIGYPRGAHYLPLPSAESTHVREMLADVGVIERDPFDARPRFDEAALVHGPEERLFHDGAWQDGLLPDSDIHHDQHARFLAHVDRLRTTLGNDGRKVFAIPLAQSSRDPAWLALDRQTFRQWLDANGYTAPTLRWYADYCCRDDYGAGADVVSAWAGLHYFASRDGHASNAADGAVLTWPDGLHGLVTRLTAGIDRRMDAQRPWRQRGMAVRIEPDGKSVLCVEWPDGITRPPKLSRIVARRVICAMPLHVAARLTPLQPFGFDATKHLQHHAPWLVSTFRLRGFPQEQAGVPLAWDNVVYGARGLGYVVATHQWIRQARPAQTAFTAYCPLDAQAGVPGDSHPDAVRRWLVDASPAALMELAVTDLRAVYGREFWRHADAVEITARGHAMATPVPGFLANAGLAALRGADGPLLFAHADLSGLSVFEEAAWWGTRAALRIVGT
ncbi:NAD(P)/FAD-dependent oxidoreductase [Cupriavidus pauculus]|uniref:FAD-dependent oxidoreductase n=1 Tax=Cupriavidus pauculus TaxID=82633 RepID=UPI001EE18F37|nr:NAD(P)/FAD-dependent oxidoreductase [Cupriavidus pauculus]GJG98094.1 NAD(P)-binding protein [Cupriavidus pauculus]